MVSLKLQMQILNDFQRWPTIFFMEKYVFDGVDFKKIPARRSLVHFSAKNDIFSRSGENARMISSPNRETFYCNFSRSGDMSPDQEKYCLFLPIRRQMLISLADRQNTHNTICLQIAWQPILCYHFYVQSSFVFYEYQKFGFHLIFIFW